jgi:hypothetical protein
MKLKNFPFSLSLNEQKHVFVFLSDWPVCCNRLIHLQAENFESGELGTAKAETKCNQQIHH